MLRLVTSLNYLIGTLAIGVAAFFPLVQEALWTSSARSAAERQVQALFEAERRHALERERYVLFGANPQDVAQAAQQLGIALDQSQFVFDVFTDAENALVIRAFTAPAVLRRGSLPPMLYRYRARGVGEAGSGEWVALSGRTPGLMNLPGSIAAMF